MTLEQDGSEIYISKSGRGLLVKIKGVGNWFLFYTCRKQDVRELLDGKKAFVRLALVEGRG